MVRERRLERRRGQRRNLAVRWPNTGVRRGRPGVCHGGELFFDDLTEARDRRTLVVVGMAGARLSLQLLTDDCSDGHSQISTDRITSVPIGCLETNGLQLVQKLARCNYGIHVGGVLKRKSIECR